MKKKCLWEILVPKQCPLYYHREWDEKVSAIAGGLTIFHTVKGRWVSNYGTLAREVMIPVRIVCTKEQIKAIAIITLHHYAQQAVLVYKISDDAMMFEI